MIFTIIISQFIVYGPLVQLMNYLNLVDEYKGDDDHGYYKKLSSKSTTIRELQKQRSRAYSNGSLKTIKVR